MGWNSVDGQEIKMSSVLGCGEGYQRHTVWHGVLEAPGSRCSMN